MIIHFKTTHDGELVSLLAEKIAQKEDDVLQLMVLGAIYVEKERCLTNIPIKAGTYIRVHLQPKKYFTKAAVAALTNFDVKPWLVDEQEHFYIVDKPHGLPSHPTLDNIQQNLLALLKRGLNKDLWLPHRLDVGTAGLIIVAKSQKAAFDIQQDFIGNKVQKIYRAIVEKSVDLKLYEHHMKKTKNAPKVIVDKAEDDTQNCLLKVTACEPYDSLYRLTLEPITGRTHQIRAQLTHLDCPIIGDKLYGSTAPYSTEDQKLFTQESFALEAYSIVWRNQTWKRVPPTFSAK